MKLILKREASQPSADCTLGLLFVDDLSLVTMERPWFPSPVSKGGINGISCVPTGLYQLVQHDSEAHPRTFALVNPDLDVLHFLAKDSNPNARTACLIHPANYVQELRGCIAPGTYTASAPHGGYMVCESRKAFSRLMTKLVWENGANELEIS